jgi:capsular exopolysaccharide synthesis family protein
MQITLKIRRRSPRRLPVEKCNTNMETCAAARLFDHAQQLDPTAVSYIAEQRKILSGVNALNDFVDLSKKLLGGASDASTPVEGISKHIEQAIQLDQISAEDVQLHPRSRIIMHTDPRSAGADRFRFLRMCLRELWNAGKLKSLQITSPGAQDGKSTIALNLATALAEGGKRKVLLIEADLHRPNLIEQLGIERRVGLAECLEARLHPVAGLRRLEPLGWYLLPAGEPHNNPTELLQTEAFAGVLEKVSPHFDWILIDSPPVIPLTDALSLARQANATLLVAREGRTPREAIEKAIAILGRQRVLGIILNAVDGLERMYSGYYGYGGNSASAGLKEPSHAGNFKVSRTRPALKTKNSFLEPPEQ